ncbi:hypothetical protein EDB85DRAFT_2289393 [Lactarius pseudohatsudake]|nr:hypothetical protein EDB85DRAFT_2289393 [Lactarius pseudohatsudake]
MACSIWDCPCCVVKARQYELTDADVKLKTALQDWRRNQYLSTVGYEYMYGPQLIMTDDILERFVELAHFEEVSYLASIHAQVSWRYIDRWGAQVLDIIKTHTPSGPPSLQSADNLPAILNRRAQAMRQQHAYNLVSNRIRPEHSSYTGGMQGPNENVLTIQPTVSGQPIVGPSRNSSPPLSPASALATLSLTLPLKLKLGIPCNAREPL